MSLITRRQVEQYRRNGFVHLPRFFNESRVQEMTAAADLLRQHAAQPGTVLRYADGDYFDRVENFVPYVPRLAELLAGPHMHDLASACLGEESVLFKDKINFKPPGKPAFPPHQDMAAGWHRYGPAHVTVLVSLDPADAENGALELAPGWHERGLLTAGNTPLDPALVAVLPWQRLDTQAGDVLLFSSCTPHRSAINASSRWRRLAYMTFGAKDAGDHRAAFFAAKRSRQPPLDERQRDMPLVRDAFGKWVLQNHTHTALHMLEKKTLKA